jgi:nanoRNase/pAp phosphatase (c-di-AMP/oligoRNAs hydrolase)
MQKAANIATALMDTASAAAGVMADAQGGFFARLAQAAPTIAFGLAQVATIARQKFQTSAASSPALAGGSNGGGSGGGGDRDQASFNIVGMGNNNQLLEAIQAQFDKPLKAYVVSRDVTRQQNLDDAIKTGAGLG